MKWVSVFYSFAFAVVVAVAESTKTMAYNHVYNYGNAKFDSMSCQTHQREVEKKVRNRINACILLMTKRFSVKISGPLLRPFSLLGALKNIRKNHSVWIRKKKLIYSTIKERVRKNGNETTCSKWEKKTTLCRSCMKILHIYVIVYYIWYTTYTTYESLRIETPWSPQHERNLKISSV